MSRSSRILIFCCLSLMIIFSFSYSIFRAYLKSQKVEFRKALCLSNYAAVREIEITTGDLYRNQNSLEWEDNNKEVVINGKYYDIISIEKAGMSAIIKIVCDEKESTLFDNFFAKNKAGKDFVVSFLKLFQFTENKLAFSFGNILFCPEPEHYFAEDSFILKEKDSSLFKPPCVL